MTNEYGIHGARVLITGGAGFIASTLAARLADDNQIILFDNLHRNSAQHTGLLRHPNVRLIEGDVLDAARIAQACSPDLDYVVHCAAIAGVDSVRRTPMRTLEVNIQGTFHLLQAVLHVRRLRRLVYFSSSEVFGTHARDAEETTIAPRVVLGEARCAYGISKLTGEFITDAWHREHDLPTVILRPFNIYGPNQAGEGAVHRFVIHALQGEDLVVYGNGRNVRAWCHVEDLVHGALLAMSRPQAVGRNYNLGDPRNTLTSHDLACRIRDLAQSASAIRFEAPDEPDVVERVPKIDRARAELGFEPRIDFGEGLLGTIDWYRRMRAGALRTVR